MTPADTLSPAHIQPDGVMATAASASCVKLGFKCLRAIASFRSLSARAEQQVSMYFIRSALSPLHAGDVAVPGICCSVVMFKVLPSNSLETLLHSSVNSCLPAAESDMCDQSGSNGPTSADHYGINCSVDAPSRCFRFKLFLSFRKHVSCVFLSFSAPISTKAPCFFCDVIKATDAGQLLSQLVFTTPL